MGMRITVIDLSWSRLESKPSAGRWFRCQRNIEQQLQIFAESEEQEIARMKHNFSLSAGCAGSPARKDAAAQHPLAGKLVAPVSLGEQAPKTQEIVGLKQ